MNKFDYLAFKVDQRDEKKQIGDLTNKLIIISTPTF